MGGRMNKIIKLPLNNNAINLIKNNSLLSRCLNPKGAGSLLFSINSHYINPITNLLFIKSYIFNWLKGGLKDGRK